MRATKTASNLEELMSKNNQLKELNMKLRQLVHEKVGSMRIVNRLANSPSFMEIQETSRGSNSGVPELSPKKKCVEIDNLAGVGEAENNFCLAPDMCRETLYSCKRTCVNRCWVDKYSKNGAPPGFGDIDQTRLNVINQRVKQMLQQVNIDLDCKPCSGAKESQPAPKANAIRAQPKAKPSAVQRKVEPPKGGDAEGDVKLGFIEEPTENNNSNSTSSSNNTISPRVEPTYGPKYTVISTNYRDDPHEVRKQQLEKEILDNKTHVENLKHLMLEDDKIKCAGCNGNKLLNNNNNKVN